MLQPLMEGAEQVLVSEGIEWGWRMVRRGHTGTIWYLLASLQSQGMVTDVTHTAWKASFLYPDRVSLTAAQNANICFT